MKYAIIAAGEGSRLAQEGIKSPKPLVEVGGEKLIDRLIRIFMDNDADEIIVICNDTYKEVGKHLKDIQQNGLNGNEVPLTIVVKTTPSSMHSFHEISRYLKHGPFCMTTVDTIFDEGEFKSYISAFAQEAEAGNADAMMGVTDYIDDEKPLYVATAEDMTITAFLDESDSCRYISGGIYGLTPSAIITLDKCMAEKQSRMRNFQRALIADGRKAKAYAFSKVLDIDHAEDIAKAEAFLNK